MTSLERQMDEAVERLVTLAQSDWRFAEPATLRRWAEALGWTSNRLLGTAEEKEDQR